MQLHFLLIQDGKILGGGRKPLELPYSQLRCFVSWKIVAGVECAAGRWVIGTVVEYEARNGAQYYRINSPSDGYMRQLMRLHDSVHILFNRIQTCQDGGLFDDHNHLPKIELFDSMK